MKSKFLSSVQVGLLLFHLERVERIELSSSDWKSEVIPLYDTRICDYSFGFRFVTFYVNEVIKPTNITGVNLYVKLSPQNVSFYRQN